MKKLFTLIVSLFVIQIGFAQTETLQLSTFDKLDVFGPFKVNLIKSETAYAEIDFNGIKKDEVVCEVQKESLKLKLKNRQYLNDWKEGCNTSYIIVNLYYNDIDAIEAAAGAIVKSAGEVKSKYLIIDCSMGAEVTLHVFAQKIDAVTTMGGILEMKGQAEYFEVKATMGAVLKARELESKTTIVKANLGADVIVNASEELEASAGFGASVDYIGGPARRNTSNNFGGEVRRRED